MKSLSRNLLKKGFLSQDETRVIDTNDLIARRIESLNIRMERMELEGTSFHSGFVSGLRAEDVTALLSEDHNPAEESGNVIGANTISHMEEAALNAAHAREEAAQILEEARLEAQQILEEVRNQAEKEKEQTLGRAKAEGYESGKKQADIEALQLKKELEQEKQRLEAQYQKYLDEIEPKFVETITGIYEHIFHVELESYREILVHLIGSAMRKAEGSHEFVVRISKEDYSYVSMQKKQLAAGLGNSTMVIIEDITLNRNQCLIETDGGIFDCGIGTQLEELHKKLLLLAYE